MSVSRPVGWRIALPVLAVALSLVLPSVASAQDPAGTFSCRSSAVRVDFADPNPLPTIEPFTANAQNQPCADDQFNVVPESAIGPVTAGVVEGSTDEAGDRATANARVTRAQIGQPPQAIAAEVLQADARVTCENNQPVLAGSSRVVGLTIGGETVTLPAEDAPFEVAVPGVGTLFLNQEERTGNSITRRALFLDSTNPAIPDVVIAEAVADFSGNPCAAPAAPPAAPAPPATPEASARLDTVPASVKRRAARGRCIARRSFRAVVRGENIQSVRFSLDGRRLKNDTSAPFNSRVPTGRRGTRHRLRARVTFTQATGAAPRTLRLNFRRCAPVRARFTG